MTNLNEPEHIPVYAGRATIKQLSKYNFLAAFLTGNITVQMWFAADELDSVVNSLRRRFKLQVDFDWMVDRKVKVKK
jgi:hypothetical protein